VIYWLRVNRYEWPTLEFEMACGRGTYVRALIRDIGVALGTGGCLTALERRAVGPFRIEEACTLEQVQSEPDPKRWLVSLHRVQELLQSTIIPSSS
jgi:tRNA pseudouridine55 synthase